MPSRYDVLAAGTVACVSASAMVAITATFPPLLAATQTQEVAPTVPTPALPAQLMGDVTCDTVPTAPAQVLGELGIIFLPHERPHTFVFTRGGWKVLGPLPMPQVTYPHPA